MAAVCDPTTLADQARCIDCLPRGYRRIVDIYLLNQIAGTGLTPQQLLEASKTYQYLGGYLAGAAKTYLLASITGSITDPGTLEGLAKCYTCIPAGAFGYVQTYLYTSAAGSTTDPNTLASLSSSYQLLFGNEWMVEIYLLGVIAGITDPAIIADGAKCFLMCLSPTTVEEINLYLLCQGLTMNLIPGGSSYGPGGTPEFDLAVSANTYYEITWGSNDLSVTICGTSYHSIGVGQSIVVFTGACTLMQFFGTFAGTTVTAIVKPVKNPIPTPTGFTWAISGANAVAGWNAPPAGIFSTELWTSTDNVTFTLAATVATPGTSATVAGPAAGVTLYAMIRFTSKVFPGYSSFTSVLSVVGNDSDISAWVARVVANGGATPSSNTQSALTTFATTLKGGTNVWSKLLAFNPIAPDGLIAAQTAVIKASGNDPWINHNFVLADLTVNGLKGDGSTKYMDTGLIGDATGLLGASAGIFVYVSQDDATTQQSEFGIYGSATNSFTGIYTHYNTTLTFGGMFRFDTGKVTWTAPASPAGFYSLQRTGATTLNIYFANSITAHASLASDASTPIGAPEHTFPMFFMGSSTVGTLIDPTKKRVSAVGMTLGLSAADDLTLYNALQALRTSFGGGFV